MIVKFIDGYLCLVNQKLEVYDMYRNNSMIKFLHFDMCCPGDFNTMTRVKHNLKLFVKAW